jgi:hypothetical protein
MLKLGLWRSLMAFGVLQLLSNLVFWWLAVSGKGVLPGLTLPAFDWGFVALATPTPVDGGQLAWHIGTVFVYRGDVWVLHNSHAMGSASLNRLRDFAWRGQRIEGFYKWK